MGCSSYVQSPDYIDASGNQVLIQFKYGFLREIEYGLGEAIQWIPEELPDWVDISGDASVPGWDQSSDSGRHFMLTIRQNILSSITEISEAEADTLERDLDRDPRHGWKRRCI
ncbi:MAG: hypothetical protein WC729_17460 [Sphingomonas sp.]|jgi:hypothetical protein|uniref:hypothetical protein n=1 Tax=Sphingomonas sp. TaxID=28214 RepID=UPI003566D882